MQVRDASMQPDELSVVLGRERSEREAVMTEPSSRRQSSLSRQFVTVMALRKVAGETESEVTDSVQTKVDSVRRQLPSAREGALGLGRKHAVAEPREVFQGGAGVGRG